MQTVQQSSMVKAGEEGTRISYHDLLSMASSTEQNAGSRSQLVLRSLPLIIVHRRVPPSGSLREHVPQARSKHAKDKVEASGVFCADVELPQKRTRVLK
jgi:hypothetical protein